MNQTSLPSDAERAKNKAALSSVLWSALLTALKLTAGVATNSLGILSEAMHSALDLLAASITWIAVRLSARPADEEHPFGHGKAENLAALVETALLFATCIWIVAEAADRLIFGAAPVIPTWWAFGVVCISLAVDINRSAMLRRVARKHRSQALEADALHFTTDIWSSFVVLVGLICAALAPLAPPDSLPRLLLGKADAVAALGVAVIVFVVSLRLARSSVQGLMDGGTAAQTRHIQAVLAENAPAYAIRRLRVRESGAHYFVDLTVSAPSSLHVDAAHEVCAALERLVDGVLPGAETTVHIEPEEEARPDSHAASRQLAAMRGLRIHALALITLPDGLHVFVHIEMPPEMPLPQAHALVSAYEQDLIRYVGAVHVVSHIEPAQSDAPALEEEGVAVDDARIREELRQSMRLFPDFSREHDVELWQLGQRFSLSFRCLTSSRYTVAQAHERAALLEAELRRRVPNLGRVSIHVEPAEEK